MLWDGRERQWWVEILHWKELRAVHSESRKLVVYSKGKNWLSDKWFLWLVRSLQGAWLDQGQRSLGKKHLDGIAGLSTTSLHSQSVLTENPGPGQGTKLQSWQGDLISRWKRASVIDQLTAHTWVLKLRSNGGRDEGCAMFRPTQHRFPFTNAYQLLLPLDFHMSVTGNTENIAAAR